MRQLLILSIAATITGCSEPTPAYAPYESEAQRETAFKKVREHCKNRELATPSCNVVILYRLPTGEPQLGVVRGIQPNGFQVMWAASVAGGYANPVLVPLESPEYRGDIEAAAKANSKEGLAILGKAAKAKETYDRAIGKRFL